MQDTEWEDVVVGNNVADTDWEDVNPVAQSVLDDRDGKIYNVPLGMDGIDTTFAIDTQHKGADKSSFFGKVFMDTAKIVSSLSTGSVGMESMFNEADFKNSKSAFRGAVGVVGNVVDTLITEATNLRDEQYKAEHGYSRYPSFFFGDDENKEEIKAKAQETVTKLENIRKKNQDWWKQVQENIVKENEMTETNRFFEGLGSGFASIGTSLGAGLASGNPVVAAGLVANLFGNMRKNELMDKALEQGIDFDDAEQIGAIGGAIEGGLEVVGGAMISKIAKLKPIIDAKNRVLSSAVVKAAQSKIGKEAVKKIATQHTDSVIGAFAKGYGSEFLEEAFQTGLGMGYENLVGLSNYSMDEIYGETLLSGIIGGITGGVAGGVGTAYNNKLIVQTNERIKGLLKSEAPSLDGQELQVMADSIQEMLFQEATTYADEFNKVLDKQVAPDTMKEGLTPDSLMAETRKLLQEKYKMNDEQINKTVNSWLAVVDARNQFNEAYTTYFQQISEVRDNSTLADMEARLAAVRAVAVAKAEGISVADAVKRMNLKFVKTDWNNMDVSKKALEQAMYRSKMTNFEDFYDEALVKKGEKQRYITQNIDGLDVDVPSDVAVHDKKDHNLSKEEWLGVFEGLKNPLEARVSFRGTNYGNISALLKIKANGRLYGIAITVNHGRKFITTAFKTTDAGYKDWVNKKIANKPAPENPARSSSMKHGDVIIGQSLPEIISNLDRDVNSLLQQNALLQESLDIANQNAELDKVNPAYESETINIDGVERTVYNSNGDRIAMSEPALRNFYNWFGDSKVVDEQGRPLVVYHGTKDVFSVFSADKGSKYDSGYAGSGFYFTSEESVAKDYAEWKKGEVTAVVMSVYLNIHNPLTVDSQGKGIKTAVQESLGIEADKSPMGITKETSEKISNTAKEKGYDGISYKSVGGDVVYVAFNPNQIKSTSNRGAYSESDNIYYQSAFAGSPVDYDRPSLEAIGSGEGNQAHGYGLYYALDREVAEGYRERSFSRKKFTEVQSLDQEFDKVLVRGQPLLDVYDIDIDRSLLETLLYKPYGVVEAELEKRINQWNEFLNKDDYPYKEYAKGKIDAYTRLKDDLFNNGMSLIKQDLGQVHEVDIPENPYLLDEDLTFDEQPAFVKEKLKEVLMDEAFSKFFDDWGSAEEFAKVELDDYAQGMTGGNIYDRISDMLGSDREASTVLEKHGVKGITYVGDIDGRCFVIFNPDDVKVIQKFYQEGANNPRGAYSNNIIYLFENADASTVIHELGHFFLDDMQKFADNETTKRQLEAIYKFVGSTDGNLTTEQHEYFANAFELYLMEGRAPNKVLEGVFVRFRKWLSRMWAEIKRISGVKLTPEIRKVFDEMLGGRGLDFAMQMSGAKMAEALESGTIPANVIAKAVQLLEDGKMSRADMDDLLARMKSGELKRSDFNQELKKFENSNTKHNERLNPFDKVKYREALARGNFSKRDVLEKINRLLKWTEPRSQNGKVVGRFSNLKMNQEFDHIRELMNMDKAQAKEKLNENIKLINAMIRGEVAIKEKDRSPDDQVGEMERLVFDNKILTIRLNKANASLLLDVYNAISDSYNMGRLTTAITGEARRARKNRLVNEAVHVLTADGDVDWRRERGKLKQFVNQLGTSQMSWQGILDILSMNDKTSKTGRSLLVQNLDVFDAQQKEAQGLAEDGEKASRFMEKKLKGVGNAAISVSRYVNSKLDEKFTIQWGLNKKTFTKDQLLDIYMKAKDEETRKMMLEDPVLQYNERFLSEVNEILTAEDRAIAEALFEFYDDNYAKINAFYEEKYGTSLGKRVFYSPRSMDRGGINVDSGDLSSYAGFSGVKERKAKAGAVKIKGSFQVLQDYIINSNHWIAWSDKLIDINAVMGDVEVKNIIRNLFGEGMEKRIAYEVSRMASNDKFQSKFGYGKLFNKIRSNYAIAALAAKPSLMIKQLTSFPAYWEHMSTAEFMSGLADFAVHMKEAVETLGNTTLMKTRDVNIIKDFEELSKSELFKKNANKVKLRELLMANIKLGDRGAIYMGGWALYKAELKKNLAKGMSEEKAKALALEKFERVTDETQQSGRLSQQSYWQSNPFLRAFTMFQSSQNQYLRKEINAIRGLATGRMDKMQAAKTLFIFHVLLPCFFQYASDGFDWDEKAQLRAALLGSLNGIFILNGILERGLDVALGTADAWKATKVGLRDVIPFWGSGEDMAKFFINLAEGDIDLEDYIEVIRAFGKPLGELTGVPVKYPLDVIQNFGNYAEEGEYKKEALLWLGWSPYALRDKEED